MSNEPPSTKPAGTPFDATERRRLAVIMFTDMVGYSALTQRNEALALQLLEEHRLLVRPLLARFGGSEIKTIGDAFLVEFQSALAAANCAVEIQRTLHDYNGRTPSERQVRLRIGLHAGDVVYKENDVFGDGVNIAARIEPLAEAGGICVSEDVARQVQNKLDCPLVKLGSGELKNITMPVAIYRIALPWQAQRTDVASRLSFLLAKKSVRRLALASFLVIAVLGAGVWFRAARQGGAPINRLAVLPLVNFSGKADEEFFADGMTEELISTLATIRDLNVIARTSVTKFKGAKLDIREIGAALMVGSILEGSVRVNQETSMARINVSLIDVRTQKTVWSEEFNKTLRDVLAVQSAIARAVSDALKVQLLSGESDRLERPMPASSLAYREYLEGRSHLNRRTGPEIVLAIANFARALEEDTSFALAAAGLAECYTLAGVAGYGSLPRDQTIERARLYAQRAVTLDDSLAEAHAALAYMRFRIDWDWAGAEAEFKRALELKPGVAHTHELYGLFLGLQKRPREALSEMRRAAELDPLSPSVSNGVGRVLHFDRRLDEAIAQFKKTIALDPQYPEAFFSLGMTYSVLGRHDEAIAAMKTALPLSSNRQVIAVMLAIEEGRAGRIEETRKFYNELLAQSKSSPVSPYFLGIVASALGNSDEAMDYFERAADEKDGILVYLPVDPVAEAIWTSPRFPNLLRKMGLKP